jgi:hypothetical protein
MQYEEHSGYWQLIVYQTVIPDCPGCKEIIYIHALKVILIEGIANFTPKNKFI